jgi:hypothetical protein
MAHRLVSVNKQEKKPKQHPSAAARVHCTLKQKWHPFATQQPQWHTFKQPNQIRLGSFLDGLHSGALEPQVALELLGYLPHQALEWQAPDQQVRGLLEPADLPQRHGSWAEPMWFLDPAGRWL